MKPSSPFSRKGLGLKHLKLRMKTESNSYWDNTASGADKTGRKSPYQQTEPIASASQFKPKV